MPRKPGPRPRVDSFVKALAERSNAAWWRRISSPTASPQPACTRRTRSAPGQLHTTLLLERCHRAAPGDRALSRRSQQQDRVESLGAEAANGTADRIGPRIGPGRHVRGPSGPATVPGTSTAAASRDARADERVPRDPRDRSSGGCSLQPPRPSRRASGPVVVD